MDDARYLNVFNFDTITVTCAPKLAYIYQFVELAYENTKETFVAFMSIETREHPTSPCLSGVKLILVNLISFRF